MQKEELPLTVDPFRSAGRALTYGGVLPVAGMERLTSSLAAKEGEVTVSLAFDVDREGVSHPKGHLETVLALQCQRCLQPFEKVLTSDFLLGLVRTGEAALTLPQRYEPFVVADNTLSISDVIEEELIISLPVVPMHAPEDCSGKTTLEVYEKEAPQGVSPFNIIKLFQNEE